MASICRRKMVSTANSMSRMSKYRCSHSLAELFTKVEKTDNAAERALLRESISEQFKDPNCTRLVNVTWQRSSCEMVETVTLNEAVHPLSTLARAKGRLNPDNRRVFCLVHEQMPYTPLFSLHVALTSRIPTTLQDIGEVDLDSSVGQSNPKLSNCSNDTLQVAAADDATCAIFYSISNLHPKVGLPPLGKKLILSAVQSLQTNLPGIGTFCTLSPIPQFSKWFLHQLTAEPSESYLDKFAFSNSELEHFNLLFDKDLSPFRKTSLMKVYRRQLDSIVVDYLSKVKKRLDGVGVKNSVAHFHLGNGASLHNVWCPFTKDTKGFNPLVTKTTWENSLGYMANYMYDLDKLEVNSERYRSEGFVDVNQNLFLMR